MSTSRLLIESENRPVIAPANFALDERYRDSNTNYLLIGNILDPLGLKETYAWLNDVDLTKLTSSYDVGYDLNFKPRVHRVPGGTMAVTAQDTGKFLRALNEGTLLSESEQAIYSSIYAYEHAGLVAGYSSIARYHKDIDAVVIQFVNTSEGNSWTVT